MTPLQTAAGSTADAWDVLDKLVGDVAQLSLSGASSEAFHHELLRRTVDALAAIEGTAWELRSGAFVQLATTSVAGRGAPPMSYSTDEQSELARRQLIRWVADRGEPSEFGPRAVVDVASRIVNPYDAVLLFAPIVVDGITLGILELIQRPEVSVDSRLGALRVLAALADCAADHHRESQRRFWQDQASSAAEFERLVAAVYHELDSTAVAYAAANEGRRWAECDRVSIVRYDDGAAQTLAVSGVDLTDRRSDLIRTLEGLATAVICGNEPLWHHARTESRHDPLVEEAIKRYVDVSDAATVVVLPFSEEESVDGRFVPRPAVGAIVIERFAVAADWDAAWKARLSTLALHTGKALRRAIECESIPFGKWWRRQYRRRTGSDRRRLLFAAYAVVTAMVVGISFLIPLEAKVETRGSLEPARRRDIFAPSDAVVAEVLVRHGQAVSAEQPLVVLHRPELAVEMTRVSGELQAAERRLAALRAARTIENPTDQAGRIQAQERSAEEEQLKESVRALGDEQKLLLDQAKQLTIRAPFAGVVTTWDVERALPGRPVARGQALLGLADSAGPWVVELLVPDRYAGDVFAARRESTEPLKVDFISATHPETVYLGHVVRIAEATETDPLLGSVVRTTVSADRNTLAAEQLRPGAVVTAHIHCGPSSLGAIYSREFRRFFGSLWW